MIGRVPLFNLIVILIGSLIIGLTGSVLTGSILSLIEPFGLFEGVLIFYGACTMIVMQIIPGTDGGQDG